jgi:hypothetical protein
VIPAMDHIDRHLASAARDDSYKPCIQAAVAMGKKLLNKYYSYTDHSELYRIAMSNILFFLIFTILISFLCWQFFTRVTSSRISPKLDGQMIGVQPPKKLFEPNSNGRTQILRLQTQMVQFPYVFLLLYWWQKLIN